MQLQDFNETSSIITELLEENRLYLADFKEREEQHQTLIADYWKLNAMYINTSEVNRNLVADNKYLNKEVNELNAVVCLLEQRLEKSPIWDRIKYAVTGCLGSYK